MQIHSARKGASGTADDLHSIFLLVIIGTGVSYLLPPRCSALCIYLDWQLDNIQTDGRVDVLLFLTDSCKENVAVEVAALIALLLANKV